MNFKEKLELTEKIYELVKDVPREDVFPMFQILELALPRPGVPYETLPTQQELPIEEPKEEKKAAKKKATKKKVSNKVEPEVGNDTQELSATPSIDDVRKALQAYSKKHSRAKAVEILTIFNVKKVVELKEEQYAEIIEKLK